jgi:hypothetical protein
VEIGGPGVPLSPSSTKKGKNPLLANLAAKKSM